MSRLRGPTGTLNPDAKHAGSSNVGSTALKAAVTATSPVDWSIALNDPLVYTNFAVSSAKYQRRDASKLSSGGESLYRSHLRRSGLSAVPWCLMMKAESPTEASKNDSFIFPMRLTDATEQPTSFPEEDTALEDGTSCDIDYLYLRRQQLEHWVNGKLQQSRKLLESSDNENRPKNLQTAMKLVNHGLELIPRHVELMVTKAEILLLQSDHARRQQPAASRTEESTLNTTAAMQQLEFVLQRLDPSHTKARALLDAATASVRKRPTAADKFAAMMRDVTLEQGLKAGASLGHAAVDAVNTNGRISRSNELIPPNYALVPGQERTREINPEANKVENIIPNKERDKSVSNGSNLAMARPTRDRDGTPSLPSLHEAVLPSQQATCRKSRSENETNGFHHQDDAENMSGQLDAAATSVAGVAPRRPTDDMLTHATVDQALVSETADDVTPSHAIDANAADEAPPLSGEMQGHIPSFSDELGEGRAESRRKADQDVDPIIANENVSDDENHRKERRRKRDQKERDERRRHKSSKQSREKTKSSSRKRSSRKSSSRELAVNENGSTRRDDRDGSQKRARLTPVETSIPEANAAAEIERNRRIESDSKKRHRHDIDTDSRVDIDSDSSLHKRDRSHRKKERSRRKSRHGKESKRRRHRRDKVDDSGSEPSHTHRKSLRRKEKKSRHHVSSKKDRKSRHARRSSRSDGGSSKKRQGKKRRRDDDSPLVDGDELKSFGTIDSLNSGVAKAKKRRKGER
jgi:hypothetical protein